MLKLTKKNKLKTSMEDALIRWLDRAESSEDLEMATEAGNRWQENKAKAWRISPDTIAVVAGNLAGILLILNFEKLGNVTSKALGFVLKGRV